MLFGVFEWNGSKWPKRPRLEGILFSIEVDGKVGGDGGYQLYFRSLFVFVQYWSPFFLLFFVMSPLLSTGGKSL